MRVSVTGGAGFETPTQVVDRFGELSDAGAEHVIIGARGLPDPAQLDLIGRDVIPHLHRLP